MASITRGDIAYIHEPKEPPVGCEIWANRPAIIVSNNNINAGTGCVEVVYLSTSRVKTANPTQVNINSSGKPALAICSQIHAVDQSRIGDIIGHVTDDEMHAVSQALVGVLKIGNEHFSTLFRKWDNYIKTYHLEVSEELDNLRNAPIDAAIEKLTMQLSIVSKERDAYKMLAESKQAQLDNQIYPL